MNRLSQFCAAVALAAACSGLGCSPGNKEAPPVTPEAEQQAKDMMQKPGKTPKK